MRGMGVTDGEDDAGGPCGWAKRKAGDRMWARNLAGREGGGGGRGGLGRQRVCPMNPGREELRHRGAERGGFSGHKKVAQGRVEQWAQRA